MISCATSWFGYQFGKYKAQGYHLDKSTLHHYIVQTPKVGMDSVIPVEWTFVVLEKEKGNGSTKE